MIMKEVIFINNGKISSIHYKDLTDLEYRFDNETKFDKCITRGVDSIIADEVYVPYEKIRYINFSKLINEFSYDTENIKRIGIMIGGIINFCNTLANKNEYICFVARKLSYDVLFGILTRDQANVFVEAIKNAYSIQIPIIDLENRLNIKSIIKFYE